MIGQTDTSTHNVWTYSYDGRNRLTGVTEKSGGTTLNQATYTYDALDHRIGIDDNGTQTWTVFDGMAAYADFNGSGSVTMRYLVDGGLGAPLARTSSSAVTAWYLTDHLGSVRDVVSTSGAVLDHVAYDAYGNIVAETNAAAGDRFKYAGMVWDVTVGIDLAMERGYDPATGRFISQDPIGFAGSDSNQYRYASNRPLDRIDTPGLFNFIFDDIPSWRSDILFNSPDSGPTDSNKSWTPEEFFGWCSPNIGRTGWGCGGVAAWRAGVPLDQNSGLYNHMDILKIPGVREYSSFEGAQAALAALGGKGLIICVQNPNKDWKKTPGPGNFATYFGTYWEYANHGSSSPGRKIIHSPTLPNIPKRGFLVVPRPR